MSKADETVEFDLTINGTLSIPKDEWDELVSAYDGNIQDAVDELGNDIEGSDLFPYYGRAWVCWAEAKPMFDVTKA